MQQNVIIVQAFSFIDASLTIDNINKVMEMVPADGIMNVWRWLIIGISDSMVKMLNQKFSTKMEKNLAQTCTDLYFNHYPQPSWRRIVSTLYSCEEMAAAREAKPFYFQTGEQKLDFILILVILYMYVGIYGEGVRGKIKIVELKNHTRKCSKTFYLACSLC